jgi:hypothetical protein
VAVEIDHFNRAVDVANGGVFQESNPVPFGRKTRAGDPADGLVKDLADGILQAVAPLDRSYDSKILALGVPIGGIPIL